jgi:MFS family permease
VIEGVAAPMLGSISDRWGVRRSAIRFFVIGGIALAAACAQPGSLAILAVCLLGFFASVTVLSTGIAANVSRRGSAAFARYVTANDVGSAAGPLIAWIAVICSALRRSDSRSARRSTSRPRSSAGIGCAEPSIGRPTTDA